MAAQTRVLSERPADTNITSHPMWKGSRFPHCLLSLSCLYVFTAHCGWAGTFHGFSVSFFQTCLL